MLFVSSDCSFWLVALVIRSPSNSHYLFNSLREYFVKFCYAITCRNFGQVILGNNWGVRILDMLLWVICQTPQRRMPSTLSLTMGFTPEGLLPLFFFQKGVGGSRFRCLIVMRRIDIYTSACDCGRHVWNRCLCVKICTYWWRKWVPYPSIRARSCLKHRHSCSVQCLTSMFALLRAKRGGPYRFRITLFCFRKSQFQSTFPSLFFSAAWPDVTFGIAAVALSNRCKNMRVDELPKPSHGLPRRDARRPPKWTELEVSTLRRCLWDNDVLFRSCVCATPPTTDKASITRSQQIRMPLGVFASVFLVATMSAFSVCP